MNYVTELLNEIWYLTLEMAPYLLLGFLIAGFLHLILNKDFIYRHLSGNSFKSVLKSTLLGIPMPVCSCGVIPISAHLNKEGASKGSVLSFLISTPTSGIDSIMATYGLMGPLFAVMRPIASFFGGIAAGMTVNAVDREKVKHNEEAQCSTCSVDTKSNNRFIDALKYGFIELIEDTGKWLIIGIVAGGLITVLIPDWVMSRYMHSAWIAYPLMILISVPMYVCATGSIPIAASLILKGMAPGAGLVFLIAGPATNTATISFIMGKFGKKTLIIYLAAIIITALLFGLLMDYLWKTFNMNTDFLTSGMRMLPLWLKQVSAIILVILLLRVYAARLFNRNSKKEGNNMLVELTVNDMTCQHCVKTITNALMEIEGIENVRIDLQTKCVKVFGKADIESVKRAIINAGYTPV